MLNNTMQPTVRPMLVPKELLKVESLQPVGPPLAPLAPLAPLEPLEPLVPSGPQNYKTTLSTLVNLFAFLSLLILSIWLYTVYKDRMENITVVPLDELNNKNTPFFIDPSIPENGRIIPFNGLQQDNSLGFMNILL
jgi:hypothetical protein